MVNKVIKPNTCKELTKKNGVSIRNSTSSAKSLKSNINLKVNVSNNSEVAVDVSFKFKNIKKVSLWAEASFKCPNPKCSLTVHRYRNLFNHFADKCGYLGFEKFQWWCSDCRIPRFWVGGSDLIRHKQDFHSMGPKEWPTNGDFPVEYLSFKAAPEDFDPLELLEHNKLFFGTRVASEAWNKEVMDSQYLVDGTHEMIYKRPDGGKESERKMRACDRVYGTMRASRSKDNVKAVKDAASLDVAKEMFEIAFKMAMSHISLSKKLVWCNIGDEWGWVTAYAAHLVGVNDIVHRAEVKSKDAEIARLMKVISDKERTHKKEMKKVTSVCDKRMKEINELAHTQGARHGKSLLDKQPQFVEQFIIASNNAIRVATEQRWEDISNLKKLTSETCSQLMTNDSIIEID